MTSITLPSRFPSDREASQAPDPPRTEGQRLETWQSVFVHPLVSGGVKSCRAARGMATPPFPTRAAAGGPRLHHMRQNVRPQYAAESRRAPAPKPRRAIGVPGSCPPPTVRPNLSATRGLARVRCNQRPAGPKLLRRPSTHRRPPQRPARSAPTPTSAVRRRVGERVAGATCRGTVARRPVLRPRRGARPEKSDGYIVILCQPVGERDARFRCCRGGRAAPAAGPVRVRSTCAG
jgi:hypothetical protein